MSSTALPRPLLDRLDRLAASYLSGDGLPRVDFTQPPGEPALVPADSVSWRIFRNPVALFIGGVAAVILELAEPRVRSGVWDHTSFRTDPVTRLKRTGLAAMVTVYGARSRAVAMIEGVNRRHARVTGVSDDGRAYAADDRELLDWVQATASYGFIQGYHRFVRALSLDERDRAWAEGAEAARLYGAVDAPTSEADWDRQFAAMRPQLNASPVIFEFLEIMRHAPAFPGPARPLQRLLVRAAVDLVPDDLAGELGLEVHGLSSVQAPLVGALARSADRLPLASSPAALASRRMGLPEDWVYRPVSA